MGQLVKKSVIAPESIIWSAMVGNVAIFSYYRADNSSIGKFVLSFFFFPQIYPKRANT